jgi:antitoxin Phd
MRTIAAKAARQGFAQLLDDAQREPVRIERNGRPVAVLLSVADFERLEALEDAWWAAKAKAAAEKGFLGPEEGERLINDLLNAEG